MRWGVVHNAVHFIAEPSGVSAFGPPSAYADSTIGDAAQKLGGQSKEAAGHATGDENLKAGARAIKPRANLKQAGEKIEGASESKALSCA